MRIRLWLLVCMPLLFLGSLGGLYLWSGHGFLLWLMLVVVGLVLVSVGMALWLRSDVAACFHLDGERVHVGRPWPFAGIDADLSAVRLRHVGAKLYRIQLVGASLVFDKSLCDCMSDEEFARLASRLGGPDP